MRALVHSEVCGLARVLTAAPLKLKDVQQNDLAISGQKTVPTFVGPTGGKHAMETTATFRVAEVRDNILSLGNWCERVSASLWVHVAARWKRTAGKCRSTWNETVLRAVEPEIDQEVEVEVKDF